MKILKKNGQKSTPKEHFFDKKKESDFKRQMTLKSICLVLITNYMNYSYFNQVPAEVSQEVQISKNLKVINLKLHNYAPLKKDMTQVTLFDQHNKPVVLKATILEKVSLSDFSDEPSTYKVVIPQNELEKIIKYKDQSLYAYPYFKKIKKTKTVKRSFGGPNEINI